jgi:hypothetical protein
MSKHHKVSLAQCIAYAVTLTADDPRFRQDVEIRHEDGTLFYLRNAFTMSDPDGHPEDPEMYLWVISEHFGEFVLDASEVTVKVFPAGPSREYRYHESCEDHGYTRPTTLGCPDANCDGKMEIADGHLIICNTCQCAYAG